MNQKIIYLNPEERDPDREFGWILIEKGDFDNYYATGFGLKNGDVTMYISNTCDESDLSLVLSSATEWADDNGVGEIYVRL